MAAMLAPQRLPRPPPRPPEPPAVLRARVVEAIDAIAASAGQESDAIDPDAIVGACRLLARAAIASSSAATSTSLTPEDLQAIRHSLHDALGLLDVAAATASSSPSAFALVAAALLLAGCSAFVVPSSPLAVSSAAEVVTRALDRLASSPSPNVIGLFRDRETAADASAGVGRLSAAAAAASTASSGASLLLLAFSRLAAASFPRSIGDEGSDSMHLVPVAHAAKMASSSAPPPALAKLLVEASERVATADASSPPSSPDAAVSVASRTFLLAGLAEGGGPRMQAALPRELVEAVVGACERCRSVNLGRHHRRHLFLERDASASAAAAVAESGALPLLPSHASAAAAAMTSVLVSLLCECGGPLDLSRELFGAAALRLPPELAAAALVDPNKIRFAKTVAPRAARALSVVAPLCPREEAMRCLEVVAAAARELHERYAEVASDVDGGSETTTSGAAWLSSPALSKSGAIRGALDAAFFSCVAALRALAVPAGALPLLPTNGQAPPLPPPPLDPRATAAALDALALVSFARPLVPAQQLQAYSGLFSSLLETAGATGSTGSPPLGVGAALAERIPSYEFFVERQRWVSDALLATRAHFYLLSLAPAARGMSAAAEEEEGAGGAAAADSAASATTKAASLALLYLGHPASEALRGAAHGLCAALMDQGGPLSACPASSSRSRSSGSFRRRRSAARLLLLPGFLDRALDLRSGVRPHYPGLAVAVAAALRGCQDGTGIGGAGSEAAAASMLAPRRLSIALRESLVFNSSSRSPDLSADSVALVSALASALLSVDARGFRDACEAVEEALLPLSSSKEATTTSSLPPLPLPLAAAAFDALGRALGSADDLLRKPALARWWARAASVVGVAAGR